MKVSSPILAVFCAGVNMAIEVVGSGSRATRPPIYVFHEIVHNRHVVEDFKVEV